MSGLKNNEAMPRKKHALKTTDIGFSIKDNFRIPWMKRIRIKLSKTYKLTEVNRGITDANSTNRIKPLVLFILTKSYSLRIWLIATAVRIVKVNDTHMKYFEFDLINSIFKSKKLITEFCSKRKRGEIKEGSQIIQAIIKTTRYLTGYAELK